MDRTLDNCLNDAVLETRARIPIQGEYLSLKFNNIECCKWSNNIIYTVGGNYNLSSLSMLHSTEDNKFNTSYIYKLLITMKIDKLLELSSSTVAFISWIYLVYIIHGNNFRSMTLVFKSLSTVQAKGEKKKKRKWKEINITVNSIILLW